MKIHNTGNEFYIPIWRDSYSVCTCGFVHNCIFTFQYGEIYTCVNATGRVAVSYFTFQYGEIRTFPHCISYQLSLALHSNMERFRCCLHYNYAFNFQISSKETQKTRKRGYHHLNHKVQMKLAPRRSSIKESSTEYFGYIFCFSYQEID